MNKIFLVCTLLLSLVAAKGQYVLIPDTAFGSFLNQNGFASCMTGSSPIGWQLDTTCNAVLDSTTLNATHRNIISIEGVQYFKSLASLTCSYNLLTALPHLSDSLTYLDCSSNRIDSLPSLPNTLLDLNVSINNIHFINALPASLYYFNCYQDSLDSLPPLPTSELNYFNCGHNPMSVPPILPASVRRFFCEHLTWDSLPILPDSLVELFCYVGHLISLPASLPITLKVLVCGNNQLISLPPLPASIAILNCNYNQLTSIPTLPANLTSFSCAYNQLTELPSLPDSLTYFQCGGNSNLKYLPYLNKVVTLGFAGTAITCLPDTPRDNININPLNTPICNSPCYPLGVNDLSLANLKVYPNPVSDLLYIDDPIDATFIVSDIAGRICSVPSSGHEIDVSALPSGVYFLRIRDSSGSVVRKFLKE